MGFPLTESQRAAVENRGGSLLVSAAAGSGKTRVLVERLLSRVTGEGLDIDRFLVITYTKAAAAELRARIVDELNSRLAETPEDAHLRRQTLRIYQAQISTIHSFCGNILRECGHLADIDPDFRLCDEGEARVLQARVLNDLLDRRYEDIDENEGFSLLTDTFSAGRDDSRLSEIVLDAFSRIQSHPRPLRWLDEQESLFQLDTVSDVSETIWGKLLLEDARKQTLYWSRQMETALQLALEDEKMAEKYAPSLTETCEGLERLREALHTGWDAACGLTVPFPRLGAIRGTEGCTETVKIIRERCKKRIGRLGERFSDTSAALLEDLRRMTPAVRALFALIRDFTAAYEGEKNRRSLLDFSDLEHRAVALLADEHDQPTALAEQLGRRYEEIMVDEYQDTNAVQNVIFMAVSDRGNKLFMVGDVKQSIYRFRLADPTIFLGKYNRFADAKLAQEGEPRRILLSQNFRSRPEVLWGTNDVFQNIMSLEFGEMEYTEHEALHPGAAFAPDDRYRVECDVLDCRGRDTGEEDSADRNLMEARFAARRIRDMINDSFPVSSGDGSVRPISPQDVAILLRSPKSVLRHYIQALEEQNLPWEAETESDIFATTEGSVALSFLQIIDNPRQDIPLISVLRSPVFAFSADRLSQLRAQSSDTDCYGGILAGAERGEPDCAEFLSVLNQFRLEAGEFSSHKLIWRLYSQMNLLGIFGAMPGGATRQDNLLQLYEYARFFEHAEHRGLFQFLTWLGRMREQGSLPLTSSALGGGGVKIMSIHKSKGLEFPVVLLCGLTRRLNRDDMRRPVLFHPTCGMGPMFLDLDRMLRYPTLAHQAVALQLEREMTAEELRVLYVAMTRAKEKLILSCALTGGAADLQKLAEDAVRPVEPQVLAMADSVGKWLLYYVLTRPDSASLREDAGLPPPSCGEFGGAAWDIRLVDGSAFAVGTCVKPESLEPDFEIRAEDADFAALPERLNWRYPHQSVVDIPSKLTATQLKGRVPDSEAAENALPLTRDRTQPRLRRPDFAVEAMGLTAAEQGVAHHLALQYMDFQKTGSLEEISTELKRLTGQWQLTPQQGAAVRPDVLLSLFQSPLGLELCAAETLHREFKFSLLTPANAFYPEAGDETVLLQGVIDCWFETGAGLVVVDFKTDRTVQPELYRPQVEAYARALTEITGKPVCRRILYYLMSGTAAEL
ncbi:MAG: helicase-exonuclease AddAB subunit AddA [Oscillospiraceae bacterium]|nr:helicase-exonuclease AddAB subunit AddA [Oscillospiraceae bacterium]